MIDSRRHLILASQSPRRSELLAQLRIPFEVVISDIDEQQHPGEMPEEYARRLSQEKAQAVAGKLSTPALIIAADTIVMDGNDVLGKPRDAAEAATMLRRLRNRTHTVITAISLLDSASGDIITEAPASPVKMRNYTDEEIADYVATGDPMDKAGAYAIQHEVFHPVEDFRHCYATVMGLPVCRVAVLLQQTGVELSSQAVAACHNHMGWPCTLYDAPPAQ
jgi:septum formation protein